MTPLRRPFVGALASAASLLIALPLCAQSADGVVYACVDRAKGNVRIVPGTAQCDTRKEYPLTWSGGFQGPPGSMIATVPLPDVRVSRTDTCMADPMMAESVSEPLDLDAGVYRLSLGVTTSLESVVPAGGGPAAGGGQYTVDVRTGVSDLTRLAIVERSQFLWAFNVLQSRASERPVFQFSGGTVWLKSKVVISGCATLGATGVAYIEKIPPGYSRP